jgi:hypothetical protein
MGLVKRQSGDRRWGMPVEYPLTDCDGMRVAQDRRNGVDRRKSITTLEDIMALISQLPAKDQGHKP